MAELFVEFAFFGGEVGGDVDFQADEVVAADVLFEFGEAFGFEAEETAGLGAGGDGDADGAVDGGDSGFAAEDGLGGADLEFGDEVVAVD